MVTSSSDSFTENDIRPDALMDGVKKAYHADIQWLISKKNQFVDVSCPACSSDRNKNAFEKNGFFYKECRSCETIYISPRPNVGLISEFYEKSKGYEYWAKYIFPASDNVRKEKIVKPRVTKVIELCEKFGAKKDLLVEVGAGFGTFSETMKGEGVFNSIVSIEPNESLAQKCKEKGLDVINSAIENVTLDKKASVVVSFEVIEHLFSVNEFLQKTKQLLERKGLAIFSCPNIKGFDNVVLGVKSSTIDHEHLNYFHPKSLQILFEKNGFDVIEVSTPGKIDVDIVRKHALQDQGLLEGQPFLKQVLIDQWDEVGSNFQDFLANNSLSGHMWIAARRK